MHIERISVIIFLGQNMRKYNLFDKVVVISGASGGIGFELAKTLITKYNCKVIGIGRNKQKLENAKQSLGELKDNFNFEIFDVSVKDNWKNFSKKLQDENIKIDMLVNNAGFMLPFAKFEKYSENEIEEIINTNFIAHVNAIKILMPLIKQSSSPAIVNVCSAAGLSAVVGQSLYCATKFALRGLTETLRQEYKKEMLICGVYPGFVRTDILNRVDQKDKNNGIINKLMMPVEKAVKKIIRGIKKRKKAIVFGFDGKSMSIFGRLFPNLTPNIITKVLKASHLQLFDQVFDDNDKKRK